MVYLHEIALPEYKTVTGSLGFVSLGIGVVVGICVVAAVIYTVPAGRGRGWGGRHQPATMHVVLLPCAQQHTACGVEQHLLQHVDGSSAYMYGA